MYTTKELQSLIAAQIQEEANLLSKTEPLNLYQPIAYALNMGGKRLRPVMVLLAYQLFKTDIEKAYPVATAIEIFHNFTLLHDDIMDRAELRRGKQVVYKQYNENAAILSGDAMSILAYQHILRTDLPDVRELCFLFSQTAIEICEGQQYDMDFENRLDVTIDEYLKMIRLKTAVLLACSLKAGALAANSGEDIANMLYELGINWGMAFQLQDDLLDAFGDEKTFGKSIGGDIIANKKTFLLLKALELAEDEIQKQLLGWITATEFDCATKIEAIKKIYLTLNIQEITREKIESYHETATQILNKLPISKENKDYLFAFTEMVMKRNH